MHEAGPKFSGESECKCVHVRRGFEQLFRAVALEDRGKFSLQLQLQLQLHETES